MPQSPAADFLVGRAVAGYEIERFVRADAESSTYTARDRRGARALVDVLPLHLRRASVGRLEDEVRAQKALGHPGLVPYRAIAIEGPLTALVCDFADGAVLGDAFLTTPLAHPEILAIALPLLEALAYAHAHGVVHGDLRPANVVHVLDGASRVPRIRRFGLARSFFGHAPLDPAFAAPERWMGTRAVDHRADLYSMGVLVFRLATGRLPFEGTAWAVLRGHVEEEPPSAREIVPALPPELDAAIAKALEKDPARRWPDAQSFADAIRATWQAGARSETETALDRVGRLQRVLADARDEGDRHALLVEIGDVWRSELELGQKALEAYAAALEAKPGDPDAIRRLAATCTTRKDWERAVRAIERIAERERDPGRRARHLGTLASVHLEGLGDVERAIACWDRALDESPGELEALEAMGRVLTERQDWAALEACYRKMLKRIEGQDATALESMLWQLLGELYRTWLGRPDAAADAFAAAAEIAPSNTERHLVLADLYAELPGREGDAVAEHERLLARDPLRTESYRALFDLHSRAGRSDGAWCAAAVLAFLQKAGEEEMRVFERHRPRAALRPRARLDEETWIRCLFHPDEDVLLGKIVEALTGALRGIKVRGIDAYGLRPEERSDPQSDTVALSRTFGWVAPTLRLPTPQLYLQPERPGRLVYAISEPPASVAGADLLSGHSPQELAFAVAQHLAYYRGEHYARWILPKPDDLRALVLVGLKLGAGIEPPAEARAAASKLADALSESPVPIAMDLLRVATRKLVEAGSALDVDRWVRAVELTACRAAFLLTADLAIAARAIDTDPTGDVPPREKVKELLRFCASTQHLRLREVLGVGLS